MLNLNRANLSLEPINTAINAALERVTARDRAAARAVSRRVDPRARMLAPHSI